MSRCLSFLLLSLLGCWPVFAWSEDRSESMPYLRCPADARSFSLAGAVGALGADAEAMWVNPAALGGLRLPRVSLTGRFWGEGVESQYLLSGVPLSRGWAVGLCVSRDSATDTYREGPGAPGGSFEVGDTVVAGTVACRKGRLAGGGSLKWVHERVEAHKGTAWLVDLGGQVLLRRDWVALGAAYQNLGQASSLAPGARPAGVLRLSVATRAYWPALTFLSEGRYLPVRREVLPAVGLQFSHRVWPFGLSVRGGYDFQDTEGLEGSGWRVGVGLAWRDLRLDYALTPRDLLGSQQRLTVGWEFGGVPSPRPYPSGKGIYLPGESSATQGSARPSSSAPGVLVDPTGMGGDDGPPVPAEWPGTLASPSRMGTPMGTAQPPNPSLPQEGSDLAVPTPSLTPEGRMKVELEYQQ